MSFKDTAKQYLTKAVWIENTHPYAHALLAAAEALDDKVTIAMFKEHNALVYKIENLKPQAKEPTKTKNPLLAPAEAIETR